MCSVFKLGAFFSNCRYVDIPHVQVIWYIDHHYCLKGALVEVRGRIWNEANEAAMERLKETPEAAFIHPYDHPLIWWVEDSNVVYCDSVSDERWTTVPVSGMHEDKKHHISQFCYQDSIIRIINCTYLQPTGLTPKPKLKIPNWLDCHRYHQLSLASTIYESYSISMWNLVLFALSIRYKLIKG